MWRVKKEKKDKKDAKDPKDAKIMIEQLKSRIFTSKTITIMKKIDLPFFSTLSYDVSLS